MSKTVFITNMIKLGLLDDYLDNMISCDAVSQRKHVLQKK